MHTTTQRRLINSVEWGVEVHLRDQSCTPNEFLEVKLYAARKEYLPDLKDRDTGGDTAILLSKVKVSHSLFHSGSGLSCMMVRYNSAMDTPRLSDTWEIFATAAFLR